MLPENAGREPDRRESRSRGELTAPWPGDLPLSWLCTVTSHYIVLPSACRFQTAVFEYIVITGGYIFVTVCNVIFGESYEKGRMYELKVCTHILPQKDDI